MSIKASSGELESHFNSQTQEFSSTFDWISLLFSFYSFKCFSQLSVFQ